MTKITVHLPKSIIDKVTSEFPLSAHFSHVYDLDFHTKWRRSIAGCNWNPDTIVSTVPGLGTPVLYTAAGKCTYLHVACDLGDVLLAYEMIRLGAAVDWRDAEGRTPLVRVLEHLVEAKTTSSDTAMGIGIIRIIHAPQYRAIIRVLVEQHADVNVVREEGGRAPLHLACVAREWDLIGLLLKHGANPSYRTLSGGSPGDLFASEADRKRYRTFVTKLAWKPRPPQVCPCWSGKRLSECHDAGDAIPYPSEFVCRCGSDKTYGECCKKRKVVFKESWCKEERWIQPSRTLSSVVRAPDLEPHGMERLSKLVEVVRAIPDIKAALGVPQDEIDKVEFEFAAKVYQESKNFTGWGIDSLWEKGLVDTAFRYAVHEFGNQMPKPMGRTASKRECKEVRDEWNSIVDRYIALGTDKRPRIEIERVAKIGLSLGPLYPRCEGKLGGKDCGEMERQGGKPLSICQKCKMAYYCSAECQRSDWGYHKKTCGTPGQREQALPSQRAFDEQFLGRVFKNVSESKFRVPSDLAKTLEKGLSFDDLKDMSAYAHLFK